MRTDPQRLIDVLTLMSEGYTNAQIAGELGITMWQVQYDLFRLGKSLHTTDRAGLVGAAYRAGILTDYPLSYHEQVARGRISGRRFSERWLTERQRRS